MAKVIISTMGTGGDVLPFIAIGNALNARGHAVTLITNAYFSEDVLNAGLNFEPLDTLEESHRMHNDGPILNSPAGAVEFATRHVIPRISKEMAFLLHLDPSEPTILVTRSVPGFSARIAASRLNLPLLEVHMSPAQFLGMPLFYELVNLRLRKLIDRELGLAGVQPSSDWRLLFREPHSIGLWPEWFYTQPNNEFQRVIRPGFVVADAKSARTFRSKPKKKRQVLICGGLGYFSVPDFFEQMLNACQMAGCTPIVVCHRRELVPTVLPPGSILLSRVKSIREILQHVHVICHHGGMGLIGDAITAGVPQLVLARGGDRPHNAACVQQLGVGVSLPPNARSTRDIAEQLEILLTSEDVLSACNRYAQLHEQSNPLEFVCRAIEDRLHRRFVSNNTS